MFDGNRNENANGNAHENGKWKMVNGNMNSGWGLGALPHTPFTNNLSISSSISVVFLDSCLVLYFSFFVSLL